MASAPMRETPDVVDDDGADVDPDPDALGLGVVGDPLPEAEAADLGDELPLGLEPDSVLFAGPPVVAVLLSGAPVGAPVGVLASVGVLESVGALVSVGAPVSEGELVSVALD